MPLGANYYVIPRIIYDTSNPSATDDITKGVEVGQLWINTITKDVYCCIANTTGAARWHSQVHQIDPLESTVANFQTDINNAVSNKTFLITPEIMYNQAASIGYDVTIPATANAWSIGVVTIEVGHTVTVDGIWTIV